MKRVKFLPMNQQFRLQGYGLLVLIVLFMLSPLSAEKTDATVVLIQHDAPQQGPSPEAPPEGPMEFDIRKPPTFAPNTPKFSLGNQKDVGVFLDKERQGLGFQWEPSSKIPSIDLGFESHNLYSLNRLAPRTEPYSEWTPQSDSQYFGQSPTAPDHSGAFLRFRW